jgi:hypothetical protein
MAKDAKNIIAKDFSLKYDRHSKKGDSVYFIETDWESPTKGSWHHTSFAEALCIAGKTPQDIKSIDVTYKVDWNE